MIKKTVTLTGAAALLVLIYALLTGKFDVTDVSVTVTPAAEVTSSAAAVSSEAAASSAAASEAASSEASSAAPVSAIQ